MNHVMACSSARQAPNGGNKSDRWSDGLGLTPAPHRQPTNPNTEAHMSNGWG